MNKKQQLDFVIPFSGLANGKHHFTFVVDDAFFQKYPSEEVQAARVEVEVVMEKSETMLVLDIQFKGELTWACDRCLGDVLSPIDTSNRLIVRFGNEESDDDDLIFLPEKAHQLNLADYFYEALVLMRPISVLHPDDAQGNSSCDPEMLKYLSELEDFPDEEPEIDPRWDALKGLKSED